MKKGVLISTTEHVLSACIGCGIDNAIVELDNLETAILDGSARPFIDAIHKAGIRKQRRPRHTSAFGANWNCVRAISSSQCIQPISIGCLYYKLRSSAHWKRDFFRRSVRWKLHFGRLRRRAHLAFCTKPTPMRQSRGLSVALRRKMLCPHAKWPHETRPCALMMNLCATKCLISSAIWLLLGKQILGNVVADRAGHAMHTALVSRLLRDRILGGNHCRRQSPCRSSASLTPAAQGL